MLGGFCLFVSFCLGLFLFGFVCCLGFFGGCCLGYWLLFFGLLVGFLGFFFFLLFPA